MWPNLLFIFAPLAEPDPDEAALTLYHVSYLAHIDLYIPIKCASSEIGIPSSLLSSSDEHSYF